MIIKGKLLLLPDGLYAPANYLKTKFFDVMTLFLYNFSFFFFWENVNLRGVPTSVISVNTILYIKQSCEINFARMFGCYIIIYNLLSTLLKKQVFVRK